mmetsp:Transcript_110900/g.292887  ORF Transcript_110900/g.292887 Transcript_110900/m.292887 type:complete len:391 (+) Transcript_110900:214-1386(+)
MVTPCSRLVPCARASSSWADAGESFRNARSDRALPCLGSFAPRYAPSQARDNDTTLPLPGDTTTLLLRCRLDCRHRGQPSSCPSWRDLLRGASAGGTPGAPRGSDAFFSAASSHMALLESVAPSTRASIKRSRFTWLTSPRRRVSLTASAHKAAGTGGRSSPPPANPPPGGPPPPPSCSSAAASLGRLGSSRRGTRPPSGVVGSACCGAWAPRTSSRSASSCPSAFRRAASDSVQLARVGPDSSSGACAAQISKLVMSSKPSSRAPTFRSLKVFSSSSVLSTAVSLKNLSSASALSTLLLLCLSSSFRALSSSSAAGDAEPALLGKGQDGSERMVIGFSSGLESSGFRLGRRTIVPCAVGRRVSRHPGASSQGDGPSLQDISSPGITGPL